MNTILMLGAIAVAQCPDGQCSNREQVTGDRVQQAVPGSVPFYWLRINDCNQYALYSSATGQQVGVYDADSDRYCRWFAQTKTWSTPEKPPIDPPTRKTTGAIQKDPDSKYVITADGERFPIDETGAINFGVYPSPPGTQGHAAGQVGDEPRDEPLCQKLRLTVIGPQESRQAVLEDVKRSPQLAELAKSFLLSDFGPNDWQVRNGGYVTTGKPTIYVQAPTGKVLHRQDSYNGPDELAQALRKANESYKPEKDPNLSAPLLGLLGIPIEVWLIAAGALWLVCPRGEST